MRAHEDPASDPGEPRKGALLAAAAALFLLASCATSSIERMSEDPRAVAVPGAGVYTWEPERGWVQPDRGDWGPAEHVRAESLEAFTAEAYADALAGFLVLEDRNEESVAGADVATGRDVNFYIGECYFHLGNYEDAVDHYRAVYRRDYPDKQLLEQALLRVYTIGMAFLKSEMPCEILGITYTCPEYGIEILASPDDGLITEYPLLSYYDTVLIEIAKYYFDTGQYPEAVPLYLRVASDLDSEWADLAAFQAALATFRQIRGIDYDQRLIQEADRLFDRYLQEFRRGDHVEEAQNYRREIAEMEGEKNLEIAKYYLRESQLEAAEIYLDRVLRDFPNSEAANEARDIQAQLDRLSDRRS